MRTCATPRELTRVAEFLEPLPEDRQGPVTRFLFEVVAECACGEPVRRSDARRLTVDRQIAHLGCATGRAGR